MAELCKTGQSQYELVVEEETVGRVWNWRGSWLAQAEGKIYHGLKSRKKAVGRGEQVHS